MSSEACWASFDEWHDSLRCQVDIVDWWFDGLGIIALFVNFSINENLCFVNLPVRLFKSLSYFTVVTEVYLCRHLSHVSYLYANLFQYHWWENCGACSKSEMNLKCVFYASQNILPTLNRNVLYRILTIFSYGILRMKWLMYGILFANAFPPPPPPPPPPLPSFVPKWLDSAIVFLY